VVQARLAGWVIGVDEQFRTEPGLQAPGRAGAARAIHETLRRLQRKKTRGKTEEQRPKVSGPVELTDNQNQGMPGNIR